MKAIVLAYHDIGCAGLEALLRNGFDVQAVFTHKDNPSEAVWFQSVAELAAARGIAVYAPEDINHPIWAEKIRALKPEIIICDEVFSGLSMSEIASMVPLIERLQMEGITLIMIEHRLRELFRVANRIMVLNFGEKLTEGTAEAVMADERVKAAYFGSQKVAEVMKHA